MLLLGLHRGQMVDVQQCVVNTEVDRHLSYHSCLALYLKLYICTLHKYIKVSNATTRLLASMQAAWHNQQKMPRHCLEGEVYQHMQ